MSNVAKKKITYHQSMLIVLLYIDGFSSQRLGQRGLSEFARDMLPNDSRGTASHSNGPTELSTLNKHSRYW